MTVFTEKTRDATRDSAAGRVSRPIFGWIMVAVVINVSLVALLVTLNSGTIVSFKDAMSHLAIARRVLTGLTPGVGQLGAVWLPLPHLLLLPFVGSTSLYMSGVAGSIPSMAAYVVTVVLVYKIVITFGRNRLAGIIGASVFGLSFPMLYLQSTAMTEPLLLCLIAASVYSMQLWAVSGKTRYVIALGISLFFVTLTRYEAWPFTMTVMVLFVVTLAVQPLLGIDRVMRRRRGTDRLLVFALPALAGIGGWLAWNLVSYGNALYFLTSAFAKPALDAVEPARGNLPTAVATYAIAMTDMIGVPVLVLGTVGMIVFAATELRGRSSIVKALPVLSVLPVIVFFVITIYTGQRPLHVQAINGDDYNLRYGLIGLLPCSVFIGYLVGKITRPVARNVVAAVAVVAVASSGVILAGGGASKIVGIEHSTTAAVDVEKYFERSYDGGLVLMESWYNENIAYRAIPSDKLVYEGSFSQGSSLWNLALGSPDSQDIRWIISRCGSHADEVCTRLNPDQLAAHYTLVRTVEDPQMNDTFRIYRHK